MARWLSFVLAWACLAPCLGAEPANRMHLAPATRSWYGNPDGSCVQCSIGMCGANQNVPEAATLLWDTPYGPKQRGGAWPGRVSDYAQSRGIECWNVTTDNWPDMRAWLAWACRTGRFAAIGAGTAHFQTLYGLDPQSDQPWQVCNNNSTDRIDVYDEARFRRLHEASGYWCVVLKKSTSEPPRFEAWWK